LHNPFSGGQVCCEVSTGSLGTQLVPVFLHSLGLQVVTQEWHLAWNLQSIEIRQQLHVLVYDFGCVIGCKWLLPRF
jgi:hypothetical protein